MYGLGYFGIMLIYAACRLCKLTYIPLCRLYVSWWDTHYVLLYQLGSYVYVHVHTLNNAMVLIKLQYLCRASYVYNLLSTIKLQTLIVSTFNIMFTIVWSHWVYGLFQGKNIIVQWKGWGYGAAALPDYRVLHSILYFAIQILFGQIISPN